MRLQLSGNLNNRGTLWGKVLLVDFGCSSEDKFSCNLTQFYCSFAANFFIIRRAFGLAHHFDVFSIHFAEFPKGSQDSRVDKVDLACKTRKFE